MSKQTIAQELHEIRDFEECGGQRQSDEFYRDQVRRQNWTDRNGSDLGFDPYAHL